jgi:hypothetical protein
MPAMMVVSTVDVVITPCGRSAFMKTLLNAALLLTLVSATTRAQINAGDLKPEPSLPFTMTQVATFKLPLAHCLPARWTHAHH